MTASLPASAGRKVFPPVKAEDLPIITLNLRADRVADLVAGVDHLVGELKESDQAVAQQLVRNLALTRNELAAAMEAAGCPMPAGELHLTTQ